MARIAGRAKTTAATTTRAITKRAVSAKQGAPRSERPGGGAVQGTSGSGVVKAPTGSARVAASMRTKRNASTGKVVTAAFKATETGRVVKSSPVPPRLGIDRIQAAVDSVLEKRG